jgi:uncharacterized protein (DUF305 family)
MYLIGAGSAASFVGITAANDHDEEDNHSDGDDDHGMDDHDRDTDDLNHADVHFLQMMIPHHEQAIEMSELVPFRTDRQELRDISDEIIQAQEAEILTMSQWLVEVGENPYAHIEMDHEEMMDEMEGMHSPEEMEHLRSLEGEAFEREFISLMIDHHGGAIQMSEEVLENGEDPEVARLAEEIIAEQEAEIEQMREWCREWF